MKRRTSTRFASFALGVLLSTLAVLPGRSEAGSSHLTLLWTNPALNENGTPCTDLAVILIEMVRESDGYKLIGLHPLCVLNEDTGAVECHSGPGLPDSSRVVVPQRQGVDWWHFTVFAQDSSGNTSQPSNVVRVDLGSGGPITGIGDPPLQDANLTAEDEWYDVHGRRLNGPPTASGLWFHRRGDRTEKVLIIK